MKNRLLIILFIILTFHSSLLTFNFKIKATEVPKLLINELMPNPAGSDTDLEWIELYNYGNSDLQLSDFKIDDTILPEFSLVKNSYTILARKAETVDQTYNITSLQTTFALNNSNEEVVLTTLNGELIDSVSYTTSHEEISLERKGWLLTEGCKELVENSTAHSIMGKNVHYVDSCWGIEETPEDPKIPMTMIITEIYPSPDTSIGEKEWIELYNYGDKEVNLNDWYFKDKGTELDGFGKTKSFLGDIFIQPHAYAVISGPELAISLNNSGDLIGLFSPDHTLIIKQEYLATQSNFSAALPYSDGYGTTLVQTTTITPNAQNIITQPEPPIEEPEEAPEEEIIELHTIKSAKGKSDKTKVKIIGCASVGVDLFGENILYIQDETGGIQIANIDVTIPQNQKIEVVGLMSTAYKARRLKMQDIKKLGECQTSPNGLDDENMNDQEGLLVKTSGKVTKLYKTSVDIEDNDGNTIKISVKEPTGINIKTVEKGDQIDVIGILSKYNDSYRILPRNQSDMIITKQEVVKEEELEEQVISKNELPTKQSKSINPKNTFSAPSVLGIQNISKPDINYKSPQIEQSAGYYLPSMSFLPLLPIIIFLGLIFIMGHFLYFRFGTVILKYFRMLFQSQYQPPHYGIKRATN